MNQLPVSPIRYLTDAAAALAVALLLVVGGAMFAYVFATRHEFTVAAGLLGTTVVAFKLLTGLVYERLDLARAAARANRQDIAAARVAVQVAETQRLRPVRPVAA